MKQYLQEHWSLYVFVTVLFLIGVGFGAILVNALTLEQKQELTRHLSIYLNESRQGTTVDPMQLFQDALSFHIKWTALIWLFGLSIIGLPLILVLDFLKGVFIGFTIGYLVMQMSWNGMLFALFTVVPHNLIVIPALLICSVSGIAFSISMIKNRLMYRRGTVVQPFLRYTGILLIMSVLFVGAAWWEGYLSPISLRWILPQLDTL